MSTINSSSLFHFTPKIGFLKKIVQHGVRFSFCFEKVDPEIIANQISLPYGDYDCYKNLVAENNGVAIPMACFCDIPLLRTNEHKEKYGDYAIGLDKELLSFLYSSIMNPVLYVHSENVKALLKTLSFKMKQNFVDLSKKDMKQLLEEIEKEDMTQIQPCLDFKFEAINLIGLSKPCSLTNGDGTKTNYYDEREWRAFWPNCEGTHIEWLWNISEQKFQEIRGSINQALVDTPEGHVRLPASKVNKAITHIIVSEDNEIDEIIKHIIESNTIFGATVGEDEKLRLISRVTSFERIKNDF